jgi:hypothetical protein
MNDGGESMRRRIFRIILLAYWSAFFVVGMALLIETIVLARAGTDEPNPIENRISLVTICVPGGCEKKFTTPPIAEFYDWVSRLSMGLVGVMVMMWEVFKIFGLTGPNNPLRRNPCR